METRAAIYIGLFLIAGIAGDLLLSGGSGIMFLARKFVDLVDWVEFWR